MRISLAAVRETKGVSQPWLEKRSGISERTIRRIENDPQYDPGISTVIDLARALGVTLDELVLPDGPVHTTPANGRGRDRAGTHESPTTESPQIQQAAGLR